MAKFLPPRPHAKPRRFRAVVTLPTERARVRDGTTQGPEEWRIHEQLYPLPWDEEPRSLLNVVKEYIRRSIGRIRLGK